MIRAREWGRTGRQVSNPGPGGCFRCRSGCENACQGGQIGRTAELGRLAVVVVPDPYPRSGDPVVGGRVRRTRPPRWVRSASSAGRTNDSRLMEVRRVSEQARGLSGTAGRRRNAVRFPVGETDGGPFPGRHASRAEIAAETPIFHALTVGGWRSRQHEPSAAVRPTVTADPLKAFSRDPLTAPIPIQALVPASVPAQTSPRTRRAASEGKNVVPEQGGGRHRRPAPVPTIG